MTASVTNIAPAATIVTTSGRHVYSYCHNTNSVWTCNNSNVYMLYIVMVIYCVSMFWIRGGLFVLVILMELLIITV